MIFRGEEPWAVLTGDTLFVNDVARPDLAIEEREGARGIYHSLMKISSKIGFERKHNPTLTITDEDEFVEQAVSKLGSQLRWASRTSRASWAAA